MYKKGIMEKETMAAVICIGLFAAIVLSIYFIMKYRSITPVQTMDVNLGVKRKSDWQKPGIVVIGTGIGVLVTGILHTYAFINNDAINVGIVAVCAGISMIIANSLDKDKSSEG